jgi:hypothetical protein
MAVRRRERFEQRVAEFDERDDFTIADAPA